MYTVPLHLKLNPTRDSIREKKKRKAMRETNAVVWAKYKCAVTVIELTGPSSWSHFSMASSSSSSSLSPPGVPMELHVTNREKLLSSLRHDLSHSSRPLHGFVFLQVLTKWGFEILKCNFPSNFLIDQTVFQGGDEQTRHDTDHIELFRYSLFPSYTHVYVYIDTLNRLLYRTFLNCY